MKVHGLYKKKKKRKKKKKKKERGNKKVIVPILIYLAGYGMTKIGHTIVVGKV